MEADAAYLADGLSDLQNGEAEGDVLALVRQEARGGVLQTRAEDECGLQ